MIWQTVFEALVNYSPVWPLGFQTVRSVTFQNHKHQQYLIKKDFATKLKVQNHVGSSE